MATIRRSTLIVMIVVVMVLSTLHFAQSRILRPMEKTRRSGSLLSINPSMGSFGESGAGVVESLAFELVSGPSRGGRGH
ncbi:hypothetical protein MRB53_004038 [Persea americana]|uniref:Uncharacterized protein n=1 Tax=Persea americana TaxID=3435 RepID=A0ACC2MZE8_PERAE|nr:hypothetical protein MRB53_004038 [Persea americana]